MAGEDARETAHPSATTNGGGMSSRHQSFAGAAEDQREYKGLMAVGFLLLAVLVVLVHLLVIYRS